MLAQGHVAEVRLKDLEFTASETKALLEQVAGVPVSDRALANVQAQLEGWIAGLHLVLLTLRYQEDTDEFLSALRGGTSRVQAYLLGEVLGRQPPAVQNWLIMTSILDRFCASLCESVCMPDQESAVSELDGRAFIRTLVDRNLFCIALDEHGTWYRYHHLFQQSLAQRLRRDGNAQEIATLHSRASTWFESQGLIEDAIRHAMAAGDVVRSAEIVEIHRYDEFIADRWYVVERWLAILSTEIKQVRPKLFLTEAWIANCRFQLARLPMIVERTESLVRGQTAEPAVLGELAFFRGFLKYWEGQAECSQRCLEEAVAQLSDRTPYFASEAELVLGLARCMAGKKELAVRALEDRIERAGLPEGQVRSRLIAGLAFIYLVCGDLPQARVEAQRLQRLAKKTNLHNTAAWSSYFLGCSNLHAGDLAAATRHFAHAVEQRYVLEPRATVDALAGFALTQQLLRLDDEAAETAGQLQKFAQELNGRQYLSAAHSCQARLSLLQGDLTSAIEWARSISETPAPSGLFMWLEAPSITPARALIEVGSEESLEKAAELLRAIRHQSEACRFTCQAIEVAVLQALTLAKQGGAEEALTFLEEAVALGEPGGWVRPFVEAGPMMADLLRRSLKRNVSVQYIRRILTAFRDVGRGAADGSLQTHRVSPSSSPQALVEPLTNREEEVLGLLAERLADKEIAKRLFVSPATVNTHLKHIYEKLHVRNRREAIARASDLGILPRR
jgi:LuxR family maltose regulon positive regulatory protein